MDTNLITIRSGGDPGTQVSVPQHVYEQFLTLIDGTEAASKLENGTEDVAKFWQELRSLAPNYVNA